MPGVMKTGMCKLDLFVQCFAIACIEAMTSFSTVILCVVRMFHPESFIHNFDQLRSRPEAMLAALNANDEVAIEMFVASFSMLIASVFLLFGLRRRSTTLIFPWIVIMIVDLGGGLVLFLMRTIAHGGGSLSVGKIIALIVYNGIMFYFFYSVYSYYVLLKKEKRLERNARGLGLDAGYPSSEMSTLSSNQSSPAPSTRSHSRIEDYYYLDEEMASEEETERPKAGANKPPKKPTEDDVEESWERRRPEQLGVREINIITGTSFLD